jgi:hypothetical protein
VSVHLVKRDAAVNVTAVELDGAGAYAQGNIARRVERELNLAQWAALTDAIERLGFWRLPTAAAEDRGGLDGSQWIIEGRTGATYHVVDRWSSRSGSYRDVGLLFLETAGLKPAADDVY